MILSLNNIHCYRLLGLSEDASIDEIKSAYRRLALEYHPDKNISAKDGAKFKIVTEAYNTIRMKNNIHAITNDGTEYQSRNKNHKHKKNNFLDWVNWFYLKIDYNYVRYSKNFNYYHLKYEPKLIKYGGKIKISSSILIHHSIRFFQHNNDSSIFRIISSYFKPDNKQ